jgi:hypothetical protein
MSDNPEFEGPYDPAKGSCYPEGHPVNEFGRCQTLNEFGVCPPVPPDPDPDEPDESPSSVV